MSSLPTHRLSNLKDQKWTTSLAVEKENASRRHSVQVGFVVLILVLIFMVVVLPQRDVQLVNLGAEFTGSITSFNHYQAQKELESSASVYKDHAEAPLQEFDDIPGRLRPSKIIKVVLSFGKGFLDSTGQGLNSVQEQVIAGHIDHAKRHGYRQYIQRVNIMNDIVSKPVTVLHILLEELHKPIEERAEWIVLHDADMVVYNRNTRLETFLPPKDRTDIHLLATRDGNGFNAGCLFFRVSPISVEMLGANAMYNYMPGRKDFDFAEQGMLSNIVRDFPRYNYSTAIVPKHWINAYPRGWEGGFVPGNWVMHTVWVGKADLPKYVKEADSLLFENNISPEESGLAEEVKQFWDDYPRPANATT